MSLSDKLICRCKTKIQDDHLMTHANNYIERSDRFVIIVARNVIRRTIKAKIIVIYYNNIKNMKSPKINSTG